MENRGVNNVKGFFPKEICFGKPHPVTCECHVCLSCDEVYDDLSAVTKKLSSQSVKSSESKQICDFLNEEVLESLDCGKFIEWEGFLSCYEKVWNDSVEGNDINNLNLPHSDTCSCLICSVRKEFVSKLEELSSFKLTDDADVLEMIEERRSVDHHLKSQSLNDDRKSGSTADSAALKDSNNLYEDGGEGEVRSYLLCCGTGAGGERTVPVMVSGRCKDDTVCCMTTTTGAAADTDLEPNDGGLSYGTCRVKKVQVNELAEMCLCGPGPAPGPGPDELSPYCLKHSVAFCQHMHNKLYEEGCYCTREVECLLCQRLKCSYCCHEREMPSNCCFLNDDETNDITLKVSSWLDDKLEEAGVSREVIRELSLPLEHLNKVEQSSSETVTATATVTAKGEEKSLSDELADHVGRSSVEGEGWRSASAGAGAGGFTVTERMKDDILNMNELFDIRLFPRTYSLKGVRDERGGYTDVEEELMELGMEGWKVPTRYVEEMLAVAGTQPDLETRLEKEEEIRKRTKLQTGRSSEKKTRILGLGEDWRPEVELCPDGTTDYTQTVSLQHKQDWAQRTYEEILDRCEGVWGECGGEVGSEVWSGVQAVLDSYGEETVEHHGCHHHDDGGYSGHLDPLVRDFDSYLQHHSESSKHILEHFQNTGIGFTPEFWRGLENWQPDKAENEVRKRVVDEIKKFLKELDSFKNNFERALVDRQGVESDAESTIDAIVDSLPDELSNKINKLLAELPVDWLETPEIGLMEIEKLPFGMDNLMKNHMKLDFTSVDGTTADTGFVDNETVHESDDDDLFNRASDKQELFFYDDEEVNDEGKGGELSDLNRVSESDKSEKASSARESISEETISPDEIQNRLKGSSCRRLFHTPVPYVLKLKEEMLKWNADGLHATQKLWYDRPMFPFWTPTVVYDLSEIEKEFFDDTPEYDPEISESMIVEIQNRLMINKNKSNAAQSRERGKEKRVVRDESDATSTQSARAPCLDPQQQSVRQVEPQPATADLLSNSTGVERPQVNRTLSDDDCLIKEDDFKAAIEQMLRAQQMNKEVKRDESEGAGGALGLDQILKGIAGRVACKKDGAVELDSSKDVSLESIVPSPALKFPFKLDIFQKQAIIALEAGLSVFVAAHTSAGKTVAAEYAIAMALRNSCRVVYTSPIKALSNQKYNDFTKKFKGNMKIGIITGDVQLNKEAECLIMTTEILRSMLYNQSSILSDLEFVVFDEVHYFNDPERGNVWEEVLILLPHHCQLIMLSATVPNVMSFASWVGTLRKRTVIVTSTTKRPVPLKHYIHFSTHPQYIGKVIPLKEAEGPFLNLNYMDAMQMKKLITKKGKSYKEVSREWTSFIQGHLKKHERLPAVIFCFSRKRCDELASSIRSIDLVQDAKKKSHIDNFFSRQINMLQPEDRDIQQIVTLRSLLQRGIGVHHSGILPILKEIVEVLFSEIQIKLLFATETFAMGVNMPAKSVIFQQPKKFDGFERRPLKPAEYTQMAGRAGRRGIDKSGTVIITEWNDDKCIKENELNQMLTGEVDPLKSQFRLRYSMILTALKPEGDNSIQSIIGKSFFNFSFKAQRNITEKLNERGYKELAVMGEAMKVIPAALRDCLSHYCNITSQYFSQLESVREKIFEHKQFRGFLNVGRVVRICYKRYVDVFGIILNTCNKTYDIVVATSTQFWTYPLKEKYPEASDENEESWYRLVGFRRAELPVGRVECSELLEVLHCKAHHILGIVKNYQYKINTGDAEALIDTLTRNPSKRYYQKANLENFVQYFFELLRNMHLFIYLQENQIHFNNKELRAEMLKCAKMSQAFNENLTNVRLTPSQDYNLLDYLSTCFWFSEKKRAYDKLKVEAQKKELKSLFNDFESKLKFLKNNKYIKEDDDVVDTKGRIASRMTNFEVFVTEILLKNVLEDLDGAETAALLSCLVISGVKSDKTDSPDNPLFKSVVEESNETEFKMKLGTPTADGGTKLSQREISKMNDQLRKAEKNIIALREKRRETNKCIEDMLTLPPALQHAISTVDVIRQDLIAQEEMLEIEPMEGADLSKVTFFLVPIVYAWAMGKPMKEIMSVLDPSIQEGILVRWIINLNETIKDIDSATHHFLKDSRIKEKFESASASIKRGIIDTPSLYLNQRTQPL